jgi:hypothetical protein
MPLTLKNIDRLTLGKVNGLVWVFLLMLVVLTLSGCSGNCNAGGNAYGGKVFCKALDF